MANHGARESRTDNDLRKAADAEVAANPPKIEWETVPGSGGIRVGRLVYDSVGKRGRPKATDACNCGQIGGARRRIGPHHTEDANGVRCPRKVG